MEKTTRERCEENLLKESAEPVKPQKWRLTLRTISAFFGYLSMGAALSILGPTLISMEILHNTDTSGISWVLFAQSIGGLGGAALCGVFLERFNPEFQLGTACILAAVALAIAPFTGHLFGFLALFVFVGISIGFLDSGSIPYLMRLWEGSPSRDTVLHAMSAFCSFGRFITPLLIRDLLYIIEKDTSDGYPGCGIADGLENNVSFTNVANVLNKFQSVDVVSNVSSLSPSARADVNSSITTFPPSLSRSHYNITEFAKVEATRYAYVVISLIPLVGAILFSVTFFVSNGFKSFQVRKENHDKKGDDVSISGMSTSLCPQVALLVLCCIYMVNHCWLENMPGAFLSSFAVKGLCMDVKTGSVLTSVYWGCHGIGRLLTIIVSRWLKPRQMLIILFSFYATGMVCGLFIPLHPRLVWVTAVLAGTGASSMYFSSLLWFSNFIRITGRISAMCVFAISFGGMVGPLFIGNMFQSYGHMWLIYIHAGALLCQCVLIGVVEIFGKCYKIGVPSSEVIEQKVIAEELTNLNENKC